MPPNKEAQGIKIIERGSNPPKREWEEFPLGDKGKIKKHMGKKRVAIEAQIGWSVPEDYQTLIHWQNILQDRPKPTPTRFYQM